VAFIAAAGNERQLVSAIEHGLEAQLGFAVPTFLRSADALGEIAAAVPFTAEGKVQVCILGDEPEAPAREAVRAAAGERDAVQFAGRDLYWLPGGRGVLDSALDMAALARMLGPMTVRTKATIEQFAAKHFAAAR